MNITFLNLLGQLLDDAGAVTWVILKTIWAAARIALEWVLIFAARGFVYLLLCAVAMGIVWTSLPGCVPTAYMAYKGQAEDPTVATEAPRGDTQGLLEALLKYDCVPAWVFIEEASTKTTVAQGCQKSEQELLPRLLQR